MGQTYKADFEVDNGTDYDKYNFSTSADQVSYTKNGKETNVQTELDALNTGLEVKNIAITSANENYITVNAHRVKQSGKVISGYVYFTIKQAVTKGANIIKVGAPIASQLYIPIFNITDKTVLYGTIDTTGYLINGVDLVAGKAYIFNLDYIIAG